MRFSLDIFPRSSSLSILCKKLCIDNDGTNAFKYKKEKSMRKALFGKTRESTDRRELNG